MGNNSRYDSKNVTVDCVMDSEEENRNFDSSLCWNQDSSWTKRTTTQWYYPSTFCFSEHYSRLTDCSDWHYHYLTIITSQCVFLLIVTPFLQPLLRSCVPPLVWEGWVGLQRTGTVSEKLFAPEQCGLLRFTQRTMFCLFVCLCGFFFFW